MKLISVGLEEKEEKSNPLNRFPTVGDMLDYIKKNKIPTYAEIVVEHVEDVYLYKNHWSQYKIGNEESFDGTQTMLPVHNGFGWIEDKKYFALWMHH